MIPMPRLFSNLRCPNPGRGCKRKAWDFSRLQSVTSSGSRIEDNQNMKPFCKADFIEYFTTKAPRYERHLVQSWASI